MNDNNDNDKCLFLVWRLTTRELTIWIAVIGAICVGLIIMRYQHEASVASVDIDPNNIIARRANDSRIVGWRLDINSATADELVMLPGIGPRRARMILQERKKRGAFQSIWELSEAPEFTKALLRRLEPLLRVGHFAL